MSGLHRTEAALQPIKRGDLSNLVELGQFLDSTVELDGEESKIRAKVPLFWSVSGSALVVLVGYQLPRPTALREPHPNERQYRTWTRGREAATERRIEIDLPRGKWRKLGRAFTIGYRSDKFHSKGEAVDYEHKFGPRVQLFVLGDPRKGKRIFVWAGGSLRLTGRGIEG